MQLWRSNKGFKSLPVRYPEVTMAPQKKGFFKIKGLYVDHLSNK